METFTIITLGVVGSLLFPPAALVLAPMAVIMAARWVERRKLVRDQCEAQALELEAKARRKAARAFR